MTVTLNGAVRHDHGVQLEVYYVPPTDAGATPLRDLSGNNVGFINPTAIPSLTNNTPPAYSSASVDGATLTVTFNGALDTGSVPAADAFTVTVAGDEVDLADTNPVAVAGKTVTLTLAEAVGGSLLAVTVAYTAPETGPLQDSDNAKLPVTGFGDTKTVTNNTSDSTVPTVSSAAVNGATMTLTFSEPLDESSVPATSRFNARVGGAQKRPNGIAVEGNTVTLTLADAAVHGDTTVRVFYVKPTGAGATPLRDLSGNEVAGFGVTPRVVLVVNNTPPAFKSASVNGDTLRITFDGAMDTDSVPAASAFTVTVDGTDQTPTRAAFRQRGNSPAADQVELILDPAVARGQQTVTVGYTAPMTDPLKDDDNAFLPVPGFTGQTVTNNTANDTTAPTFASASVNGNKLAVKFSEALDESSVPAATRFRFKVGTSIEEEPTGIGVEGDTVTLTLDLAVSRGDTVQVRYQKTSTNPIQDLAGNALETFDLQAVDNDTPANNGPGFASASVDGATLTITFDEALDTSAVPAKAAFTVTAGGSETPLADTGAVAVAGSAVTLTLAAAVAWDFAVTVGYDKSEAGTDKLRGTRGANEVETFSGKSVVNESPAPAPSIVSVAIESLPSVDADSNGTPETYGVGEHIQVKVTWSSDVLWDVSAAGAALAVRLDIGGTVRMARFSTGGATSGTARALVFGYTVAAADSDTNGFEVTPNVAGDLVVLSSGATLKDAQDRNASRTHPGLSGGGDHKVDGGAQGGAVRLSVSSAAGADGTYAIGDTISLTATFDEAMTVTTAGGIPVTGPRIGFTLGTATKHAVYASGTGSTALVFEYAVAEGDSDRDGIEGGAEQAGAQRGRHPGCGRQRRGPHPRAGAGEHEPPGRRGAPGVPARRGHRDGADGDVQRGAGRGVEPGQRRLHGEEDAAGGRRADGEPERHAVDCGLRGDAHARERGGVERRQREGELRGAGHGERQQGGGRGGQPRGGVHRPGGDEGARAGARERLGRRRDAHPDLRPGARGRRPSRRARRGRCATRSSSRAGATRAPRSSTSRPTGWR